MYYHPHYLVNHKELSVLLNRFEQNLLGEKNNITETRVRNVPIFHDQNIITTDTFTTEFNKLLAVAIFVVVANRVVVNKLKRLDFPWQIWLKTHLFNFLSVNNFAFIYTLIVNSWYVYVIT